MKVSTSNCILSFFFVVEHVIYYYFGAYKALCWRKLAKHRTKEMTFAVKNTEIEQKTFESFRKWSKDKHSTVKYKLVHSWRSERLRCIHVMHYKTITASQSL